MLTSIIQSTIYHHFLITYTQGEEITVRYYYDSFKVLIYLKPTQFVVINTIYFIYCSFRKLSTIMTTYGLQRGGGGDKTYFLCYFPGKYACKYGGMTMHIFRPMRGPWLILVLKRKTLKLFAFLSYFNPSIVCN